MATGSDFAWPSVTVKRGSTVVKGRSIVKCSWSDNFGILLEKVGSEFSAEVVIQVVISKNEKLDTTHTVPLDAPVKLLETYGCLYVCYYLADNTVRETSQESPNALTMLMQFFNDIHIYFSFSSRPTDPKFLTGQPEKQQINLEWPNTDLQHMHVYMLMSIGVCDIRCVMC